MAQLAEELGYRRVWYAEHHNMSAIASSATSVLIAHVAAQTEQHPPRRRRRDAAQPLAADHRRAVRHPRNPAPGPDRPGPGPRARQRPEHPARPAPGPDVLGQLPAGRAGTAGLPDRPHPHPGRGGHPGQGHQRAAVHPGILAVRRQARRPAGPAVRLRLALRAQRAAGRRRHLPPRIPALRAAGRPARDRRRQRDRGGFRGRGAGDVPGHQTRPRLAVLRQRPRCSATTKRT